MLGHVRLKYSLDTNVVALLLNGDENIGSRIRRHLPADFALSSIVVHELHVGACKTRRVTENIARIYQLRFPVLDFDEEDARAAGEIRALLVAAGTPIGPYDVLIAGQARARDLVVVTRNTAEFTRVPGLRIEDWLT